MTDYEKMLEESAKLDAEVLLSELESRAANVARSEDITNRVHYLAGQAEGFAALAPKLAAALRGVMAERDGARAALTAETRNANAYAHERDTMRSERDACSRAHEAAEARLVVVERERDTALSDVEAMRAVCDAARFVEHYAADMGDCAVCNRPIEAAGDCCDEECPGRLLRDALRALDARATPSTKERL